jgi:hypothetical protein
MRKILTYQAPSQLVRSDSQFQRDYVDCIHIVATNSLKSGIGESLRMHQWIKGPIITFKELFKELAGDNWSSSKAQLRQFLQLSEVLSELWEKGKGDTLLKLQAKERNQIQLLSTLRTLTEIGMTSNDIKKGKKLTDTEKLFNIVWSEMESSLNRDSLKLKRFLNEETESFKESLMNWAKNLYSEKPTDAITTIKRTTSNLPADNYSEAIEKSIRKKKLILHGFYFITPIQELIFKSLERKKYELIFLNSYDKRFPETFESVKFFLGFDKNEILSCVDEPVAVHPLAAKLLEALEGGSNIQVDQTLTAYFDLPHFIEAESNLLKNVKEIPETDTDFEIYEQPYHLITPRAKEVEEQLIANGLVPSTNQKLTDYPVGRYLYQLHKFKTRTTNPVTGDVKYQENVTPEVVLDCFSSGCLVVNDENMRLYAKSLEKIIPYCENITTFEGWYSRIKSLINEKKLWEEKVREKNPQALINRTHKFHALPLRQLSYFSVEVNEINVILEGIKKIENIQEALFSGWDNNKVDMQTHLRKLEQLVLKKVENFFDDSEREIVKSIIKDISQLKDDELEFSLKDITNGLLFYLDGSFNESQDDGDIERIYSFDSADGAPFRVNRNYHLAFLDHKALPIEQSYSLWPISRELLTSFEKKIPELSLLEERKKRNSSITRYLLYVLFHSADDVRFSYVKNLGSESRLEPNLYIKLLGCKEEQSNWDYKFDESEKKEFPSNLALPTEWTYTMKREAQVCPKRASFSFILNEHTTFTSDFHHGFLYENFVSVLKYFFFEKGTKNIKSIIDTWFPQWSSMKKDFLHDHITTKYRSRGISPEKVKVDGVSYSQGIGYLSLLPTSYAATSKYYLIAEEDVNLHKANPGKHCRYCPYIKGCQEGVYSIDFEDGN